MTQTAEALAQVRAIYQHYPEQPYIAPERDLESWLFAQKCNASKRVPQRNMTRLSCGLLPGHIILLWRINFGTYTTETPISKYFEYTYGIDATAALAELCRDGMVVQESARASLDHLPATFLRHLLKEAGVSKISQLNRAAVDQAVLAQFSEEQLAPLFAIRGYRLTEAGAALLEAHRDVIARHPQKKGLAQ